MVQRTAAMHVLRRHKQRRTNGPLERKNTLNYQNSFIDMSMNWMFSLGWCGTTVVFLEPFLSSGIFWRDALCRKQLLLWKNTSALLISLSLSSFQTASDRIDYVFLIWLWSSLNFCFSVFFLLHQVRAVAGPLGQTNRIARTQIWWNKSPLCGHHNPARFSALHNGQEIRLDYCHGQSRETFKSSSPIAKQQSVAISRIRWRYDCISLCIISNSQCSSYRCCHRCLVIVGHHGVAEQWRVCAGCVNRVRGPIA